MGERPDPMRRDPLDRRDDPLDEGIGDPLTDPSLDPEVVGAEFGPDPAIGGSAVVDTVEVVHVESGAPRPYGDTGFGSNIVEAVRANPLPAALTGLGVGWLLMKASRRNSERYGPASPAYPPPYEVGGSGRPSPGRALERAQGSVGETAGRARGRVEESANRAQERAGDLAEQTRHQAQRARGGFERMLRENPLTVGALAVGAGAAVGLAIPSTSKEHEVMGEARDTVVEKAQEKAQDVQQRVQQVAQEAQSAAKDEADNQGLTDQ
jgi:ElaB/YqjD/DUF883 family membrane-anchored ribosome-binding protein